MHGLRKPLYSQIFGFVRTFDFTMFHIKHLVQISNDWFQRATIYVLFSPTYFRYTIHFFIELFLYYRININYYYLLIYQETLDISKTLAISYTFKINIRDTPRTWKNEEIHFAWRGAWNWRGTRAILRGDDENKKKTKSNWKIEGEGEMCEEGKQKGHRVAYEYELFSLSRSTTKWEIRKDRKKERENVCVKERESEWGRERERVNERSCSAAMGGRA